MSSVKNVSTLKMSKRDKFLASYFFQQNWTLTDSVIYYITKNPSTPNVYQKMIQSCKYFFIKNSILIINELVFANDKRCDARIPGTYNYKYISLTNILSEFWILDEIVCFFGTTPNRVSSFIPQIYRCDAKYLNLYAQNISFEEFLFLSSNVEKLNLYYNIITNEDGSIVPLKKLFKYVPKTTIFYYYDHKNFSSITKNTAKELLKITHFQTIDRVHLGQIPNTFDIESIYVYLKKNQHTEFHLGFSESISDVYKNRLEQIVNEIIQTENHDYKPFLIHFNGIEEEKFKKLLSLFKEN